MELKHIILRGMQKTGLYEPYKLHEFKKNAKEFLSAHTDLYDSKRYNEVYVDMVHTYRMYGFSAAEYFQFDCFGKDEAYKKSFISNRERKSITSKLNKNPDVFNDKWKTYELLRGFYCRDVCYVSSENPQDGIDFIEKHKSVIFKPCDQNRGRGVKIVSDCSEEELISSINKYPKGIVLEEVILQGDATAKVHPKSVNTVRISTMRFKDSVECLFPTFRMGRGKSIVDNAGAGGIFGAIDIDTGKIIGVTDELGYRYSVHPDTKIPLIGFELPNWGGIKQLAIQLSSYVPENHYCSWDFAWTKDGKWVVVEGNASGEVIYQEASLCGVRSIIEDCCNRIMSEGV